MGEGPGTLGAVMPTELVVGKHDRLLHPTPPGPPCQHLQTSPATGLTCLLPGDISGHLPVGCITAQRDVLLQKKRDQLGSAPHKPLTQTLVALQARVTPGTQIPTPARQRPAVSGSSSLDVASSRPYNKQLCCNGFKSLQMRQDT